MKEFEASVGSEFPDMESSLEAFTKEWCLGLETLSPVRIVEAAGSLEHLEVWSPYRPVAVERWDDEDLDRVLASFLK